MKKVINRKIYDTDTATMIASREYGEYGDFHSFKETLYVTKKGAYFMEGQGGAATEYSVRVGPHSRMEGTRIIPMSAAQAMDWCEEHDCPEAFDSHFAEHVTEA